jgi:hypothetical protein
LKYLDVSYCDAITDTGLQQLAEVVHGLLSVDLSLCNVGDSGIMSLVSANQGLEILVLRDCIEVSDESMKMILHSLSKLAILDISSLDITDEAFESFPQVFPLEMLNVSDCENLSENSLRKVIDKAAALKVLDITDCDPFVTNDILEYIPDTVTKDSDTYPTCSTENAVLQWERYEKNHCDAHASFLYTIAC